jgi:hypothetical protein
MRSIVSEERTPEPFVTDPDDVVTLEYAPRQRRKLPVWARRLLWLILILGVAYAFYPHGFNSGNVTFTCGNCGGESAHKRIEAIPPRWLSFERYAGWTWEVSDPSKPVSESCSHDWRVSVDAEMRRGRVSGRGSSSGSSGAHAINGIKAVPENASKILDELMSPSNHGIHMNPWVGPNGDT